MAVCTAKHDNTEVVKLLLEAGADPNVKFITQDKSFCNDTALIMATDCNNKRQVQLLLERGADPNIQSESDRPILNGKTALMVASFKGHLEIVQLLLKVGADPNIKCEDGGTALTLAVCSGHRIIVNELLKAGANATTGVIDTEFGMSVKTSIIQLCISHLLKESDFRKYIESQPTLVDRYKIENVQFLEKAVSKTRVDDVIEILRLLLEATPQPMDDPVSLIFASTIGNVQVVDMLLKAGCNPLSSKYFEAALLVSQTSQLEIIRSISCPSLVFACINGHLEIVKLLLKEIHNFNHQQETGETILMIACECGHIDIILTLLENGADPNICDNDGNNALHYALLTSSSEDNTIDIIQKLLSRNVNVNVQNKKKVTPLMIASEKGYTEVLSLLLEPKADPDITDSKGDTALMRTSANGKSEAVALLLMAYEANPSVINYYGSTALRHAANNGHIEVITVLLSNYNPDQEEMEKAVTAACYGGHKNLIKLLVDKSNLTKYQQDIFTACVSDNVEYIIDQVSSDLSWPLIKSIYLTPLMIASSCGSEEVVQTLLLDLYDADVNKQDNYLKLSPISYAISGSKSISVVRYLLNNGANVNAINIEEMTPLDIAIVMI